MRRSDIRAVGELAGEASSVLTSLVRGMHAGIASRVFGSIGPSAAPTRAIHDGLTQAIYAGVDRGMEKTIAPCLIGERAKRREDPTRRCIDESREIGRAHV